MNLTLIRAHYYAYLVVLMQTKRTPHFFPYPPLHPLCDPRSSSKLIQDLFGPDLENILILGGGNMLTRNMTNVLD